MTRELLGLHPTHAILDDIDNALYLDNLTLSRSWVTAVEARL